MEDQTNNEHHKVYELAVLLNLPEADSEIVAYVTKMGGQEIQKNPAHQINLAYPIKKHQSAYFLVCRFLADPEIIKRMSDDLLLHPKVIRFLIVSPPPVTFVERVPRAPRSGEVKPVTSSHPATLTNEALEEKLEEILK